MGDDGGQMTGGKKQRAASVFFDVAFGESQVSSESGVSELQSGLYYRLRGDCFPLAMTL